MKQQLTLLKKIILVLLRITFPILVVAGLFVIFLRSVYGLSGKPFSSHVFRLTNG